MCPRFGVVGLLERHIDRLHPPSLSERPVDIPTSFTICTPHAPVSASRWRRRPDGLWPPRRQTPHGADQERSYSTSDLGFRVERTTGIEPASSAWKAGRPGRVTPGRWPSGQLDRRIRRATGCRRMTPMAVGSGLTAGRSRRRQLGTDRTILAGRARWGTGAASSAGRPAVDATRPADLPAPGSCSAISTSNTRMVTNRPPIELPDHIVSHGTHRRRPRCPRHVSTVETAPVRSQLLDHYAGQARRCVAAGRGPQAEQFPAASSVCHRPQPVVA